MSEYIIIAENIIFKNDKLTCINIYDSFRTIAMPAEFIFDMVILCGPDWSEGEHKLKITAEADNGRVINIGTAEIKIPHKDFVYNAFLNNIKLAMDYSVNNLTFIVTDNGKKVISRKFPVNSMLVPKKTAPAAAKAETKAAPKAENKQAAGKQPAKSVKKK